MARYTGPKNKLNRKIGEDLGVKANALKTARRLAIRPGQHGARGRRKLSDYGTQLQQKQKLKYIYGILEKQLRRVYDEAAHQTTATGATMLSYLERRLDNMIYRLGWAPTRAAARQLVSHRHVLVNGKKLNIPSYRVNPGEVITLDKSAMKIPAIAEQIEKAVATAEWLEQKAGKGRMTRLPNREDIRETIDEQLVVEYYSR